MASLKDTKRRISSVKSTQKITRAMKLVSSAKYARANRTLMGARPYGEAFERMIDRLLKAGEIEADLLTQREEKKALLIVMATDRGLCGNLNSSLFKTCDAFLQDKTKAGVPCDLMLWGRRAILFGQKTRRAALSKQEKVLEKPTYEFASDMTAQLSELFTSGAYDRIYLAYSKFKSAISQVPTLEQLLPIVPLLDEKVEEDQKGDEPNFVYLFEPQRATLLDGLLRRQLAAKIYGRMLEGSAAEHAARMAAMDSATNNAEEVVRRLTLEYNRARQAAITKELIEITSGAEAL